jgi:hypothetical protein
MDEKTAAKIESQGEKFDAQRDPAMLCYLLKRGAHSDALEGTQVTTGFAYDRETDEFRFAKTDGAFRATFRESTHIAYGATGALEVFEMQDEQKTETLVDNSNPFYQTVATLDRDESFTP